MCPPNAIQPNEKADAIKRPDSVSVDIHFLGDVLKPLRIVFRVTLFLFTLALAHGAAAGGQGFGGGAEVRGTVRVGVSERVPMIQVTLLPTSGGPTRDTFTDTRGEYFFEDVPAGSYEIVIRLNGYTSVRRLVEVINAVPVLAQPITLQPVSRNSSPSGSGTVSVQQLLIPEKARREYSKGLKSAARGKVGDAIKHWQKSLRIFPRYAESYMQLSRLYANRSDFTRAIDAANHAIDIDPKSGAPYECLGYAHLREKDFPKAKADFVNAVKLSDSLWFSQFWLGKLLFSERDTQGAYAHLLRAWQLKPNIPEIEIALYDDLLMLGRLKDALASLDDFLARFPGSPLAGDFREKRERLAKAIGKEGH